MLSSIKHLPILQTSKYVATAQSRFLKTNPQHIHFPIFKDTMLSHNSFKGKYKCYFQKQQLE